MSSICKIESVENPLLLRPTEFTPAYVIGFFAALIFGGTFFLTFEPEAINE